LDHTVLSGFRIITLDFSKLEKRPNVTVEREGQFLYRLADGNGFRWLKIEDPAHFGTLVAGVRKKANLNRIIPDWSLESEILYGGTFRI
jgi:hypothetical protein